MAARPGLAQTCPMITELPRNSEQVAIDLMMDAYVSWREECVGVADAFAAWCAAPRHERETAWAVYVAALDLEEHAAVVYRRLAANAQSSLAPVGALAA